MSRLRWPKLLRDIVNGVGRTLLSASPWRKNIAHAHSLGLCLQFRKVNVEPVFWNALPAIKLLNAAPNSFVIRGLVFE